MPRQTAAQRLEEYRQLLIRMAGRAHENGASLDEVNAALTDFGLPPMRSTEAPGRAARYRAMVWVEVETPDMSQVQAQAELDRYITTNNEEGYIDLADETNGHEVIPGSMQWRDDNDDDWQSPEEFWATRQPEGPTPGPVNDLAELKRRVRKHFLRMASVHGWSCNTFSRAWSDLDLGDVPRRTFEYFEVPVTGTVQTQVAVWDGMTDEDREAQIAAQIANRERSIYVPNPQVAGPARPVER